MQWKQIKKKKKKSLPDIQRIIAEAASGELFHIIFWPPKQ